MGINEYINSSSIIKQRSFNKGSVLDIDQLKDYIDRAEKSVCEIILDKGFGTGVFCKIRYPDKNNKIYCLITSYHNIDDNMLNYKEYIEIKMNNKKEKLNLKYKRKIWTNREIDFTCIEIIKEDNIIENINPFDINDNCYNKNFDNKKYNKEGILMAIIGPDEKIKKPEGIIYYLLSPLFIYIKVGRIYTFEILKNYFLWKCLYIPFIDRFSQI